MKEHFDGIGNPINVGDEVLILVPKTDASYRRGFVEDFRREYDSINHCEVLVSYNDGRLYCNKKWFKQKEGDVLEFKTKVIKSWRSNRDIIKYKEEYIIKN